MGEDVTRFGLRDGMELAAVELSDLWWHYVAVGGVRAPKQVGDWIMGVVRCPPEEHDLIAQALNEVFLDRGVDTFPVGYSESRRQPKQSAGQARWAHARSYSGDARREAQVARRRSADAARRAATLHATAALLMEASGQLQLAQQARYRAATAERRGDRLAA